MRIAILLLALCPGVAAAQHAHSTQPYAGEQERQIKALSAQELQELKSGAGMGLALAAELNGYPGPRHVLELADSLALSGAQRARTQQLFDGMRAEAVRLGESIIAAESALDAAFAQHTLDAPALERALLEIGALRARLRLVHLRTHLALFDVLTSPQRARYAQLRGYAHSH